METSTVLTSAVVGAVMGAVITSGVSALSGWRDRSFRKKELLFRTAVDLARTRNERAMQISKDSNKSVLLRDDIDLAETYHKWLQHLFEHGKLSEETRTILQEAFNSQHRRG